MQQRGIEGVRVSEDLISLAHRHPTEVKRSVKMRLEERLRTRTLQHVSGWKKDTTAPSRAPFRKVLTIPSVHPRPLPDANLHQVSPRVQEERVFSRK